MKYQISYLSMMLLFSTHILFAADYTITFADFAHVKSPLLSHQTVIRQPSKIKSCVITLLLIGSTLGALEHIISSGTHSALETSCSTSSFDQLYISSAGCDNRTCSTGFNLGGLCKPNPIRLVSLKDEIRALCPGNKSIHLETIALSTCVEQKPPACTSLDDALKNLNVSCALTVSPDHPKP